MIGVFKCLRFITKLEKTLMLGRMGMTEIFFKSSAVKFLLDERVKKPTPILLMMAST